MTRIPLLSVTSLLMICCSAAGIPAYAQHFMQIPGSLTQIAVGRAEVWGLNGSNIYRFNAGQQKFNQITGSLAQIAVGGGSLLQQDEVWGVNAAGQVFQYNLNLNEFDFVPGTSLNQIAVGEGDMDNCHPYEVWGIGSGGSLWRYNRCKSEFQRYDLAAYNSVAVGRNDIWGIRQDGTVIHFSPGVDGEEAVYSQNLQQIASGINDIWAIDKEGGIHRYDGNTGAFDSPSFCDCIAGQVAAGGDGVWMASLNKQGPRTISVSQFAYSSTSGYDESGFFNPVFSMLAGVSSVQQLAVGSGGGVWLITSTEGFKFQKSYQVYTWVRP